MEGKLDTCCNPFTVSRENRFRLTPPKSSDLKSRTNRAAIYFPLTYNPPTATYQTSFASQQHLPCLSLPETQQPRAVLYQSSVTGGAASQAHAPQKVCPRSAPSAVEVTVRKIWLPLCQFWENESINNGQSSFADKAKNCVLGYNKCDSDRTLL